MRAIFAFWLLCCFCTAQEPIKVVTWNLQWFPGKRPAPGKDAADAHVVEVRAALKQMQPDVLILQEVASESAVTEAIADLPGFKVAVVSRFKSASGFIEAQQVAICSRFPAKFIYSTTWAKGWAGPPRGFAFASLDCGAAGILNVYGLHLKSNLGDAQLNTAKREDAMEQLLKHASDTGNESPETGNRWVICGDFNTDSVNAQVPSERTFHLLAAAGFDWAFDGVPFERRVTCPAKGQYPDACFDHFFTKGLGKPVARPLPEILGSDHLPVMIEIPPVSK